MTANVTTTAGSAPVAVAPEPWQAWLVDKVAKMRASRTSVMIFYDAHADVLRVWSGTPAGRMKMD